MHNENCNNKCSCNFETRQVWNTMNAECKEEGILYSESISAVGIKEMKTDVTREPVENKINSMRKRANCLTTFVLIIVTLLSSSLLLYRGSICVSK